MLVMSILLLRSSEDVPWFAVPFSVVAVWALGGVVVLEMFRRQLSRAIMMGNSRPDSVSYRHFPRLLELMGVALRLVASRLLRKYPTK
jgi:hypothetical protein